ncbi:MAG: sigma-70 family RNA polymerase sigma factor [Deltaproteobacteria bacterium]|nr:sigma-70 family RNA polymerase sigma factor [Deltaproteobacteria bacterium]
MSEIPEGLVRAREEFLSLVQSVRPELHRYCARLTGSVIDGEDIVQDTLAKALYALSLSPEVPVLRPWLFRIAHNTALDFLKRHSHRLTDPSDDMDALVDPREVDPVHDPLALSLALRAFLTLPVTQRCAVILKDVLDHTLEQCAVTMETSVPAVKAALVRGRAALRAGANEPPDAHEQARASEVLARYVALFNAGEWDGVRALVGEDCRLDLVGKSQRSGRAVGMYFARYEREFVTLRVGMLDGQLALGAYLEGAILPRYWVLVEVRDGAVRAIRDYRYVSYIAEGASFAQG